ncbi:MAG: type II toxin-antitoxin system RelE/ParE family toxin [Saccharofermentanales bacterium]
MQREFVMMPEFDRQWELLGLSNDDLYRLQREILTKPEKAPVIQGTGGLRKLRFAYADKGKRGGLRVLYVDFVLCENIYLVYAYSKSDRDNLSNGQKLNIRKVIDRIDESMKNRRV